MLFPKYDHKDESGEHFDKTLPTEISIFTIMVVTVFMMFLVTTPLYRLLGKMSYATVELMLIVPAMIYLIGEKFKWKTVLRLNGISASVARTSFLIAIAMVVISDELDRLVAMVYSMPESISASIAEGLQIHNFYDLVMLGLGAVVVASIVEEALFRGFLQRSLEKHRNVTSAVMTGAIFFALIHLNPWWIIQILILAMLLGILAWRAESIIPGVIVHMVNNTLGLWSVNTDLETPAFYLWHGHVNPIIFLSAILLMIWSLKKFFRLTTYLHPGENLDTMVSDFYSDEDDDESQD